MGVAWQCMRSLKQQRRGKQTKEARCWYVHSGLSLHFVSGDTSNSGGEIMDWEVTSMTKSSTILEQECLH